MSNDALAKELRELAAAIDKLCRESGCASVAGPIVRNCCDHLFARAYIVVHNGEYQRREQDKTAA